MKKILILFLILSALGGVDANAQKAKARTTKSAVYKKPCYKDANKNKICDNYEKKSCVRANNRINNQNPKNKNLCNGSGVQPTKKTKKQHFQ